MSDRGVNGKRCVDPRFIYLQHGQLHIGDFNTTVDHATGTPPFLDWRYQLQVEGHGYIRKLTQGFPHRKRGLEAAVETVEDEPTLLTSTSSHVLEVSNLSHHHSSLGRGGGSEREGGLMAGAFFEIAVSGAALGAPDCSESVCVFAAKFMVVPATFIAFILCDHCVNVISMEIDHIACE